MLRDMSGDMQNAVSGAIFRPVLIGYLDIMTDPVQMWTGPGTFGPSGTPDTILNGKLFTPFESFVDVSDIKEDDGIGGPVTILLKGADLDETALRQIVRDRRQWRGRAAYLWLGILNTAENAVLSYPIRIKTGVMTRFLVSRAPQGVSLELTVDEDLGGAKSAPFRITDHREVYPTDTFSAYLVQLANKPQGLEQGDVRGSTAVDAALAAQAAEERNQL